MTLPVVFPPASLSMVFSLRISEREYKKAAVIKTAAGKNFRYPAGGVQSGVDFFFQCDDDGTVLSVADAVCGQRGVAFQRDMDDSAVV